jgi:hypothetical protein
MFTKKSIGAALVCALALGASGAAFATPVNVGGVVWDPASPLDLQVETLNLRENAVDSDGDVLMGYGRVGSINGSDEASLCPGCDLTFLFQYTVKNVDMTDPTNPKIVFDMGSIDFYVDSTDSFDVTDPATAGIGPLWLSLQGHEFPFAGFTTVGELYSNVTGPISTPRDGSSGFGLLDVTGGLAASWFDTNSRTDGADFLLNSSFQDDGVSICGSDGTCYTIAGQGGLKGNTMLPVPVPEPAELGLLGLGLGALGFFIWRRRKEEGEDRG